MRLASLLLFALPTQACLRQLLEVCSSSQSDEPGKISFYFGTTTCQLYSAPGQLHVRTPAGVVLTGQFNDFKCTAGNALSPRSSDKGSKFKESVMKTYGLAADADVTCYREKDGGKGVSQSGNWWYNGGYTLYQTQPLGDDESNTHSCYHNYHVRSWYRVTISEAVTGEFEVWTTGAKNRKWSQGSDTGAPCQIGYDKHFMMKLTVAQAGKACQPFTGDIANAVVPDACKSSGIPNGFLCDVKCPKPYFAVGQLSCDNGEWFDSYKCTDKTCRSTAQNEFTGMGGVGGTGCGGHTAVGTACTPTCKQGDWWVSTAAKVTCEENGQWSGKGQCFPPGDDVPAEMTQDVEFTQTPGIDNKFTLTWNPPQQTHGGSPVQYYEIKVASGCASGLPSRWNSPKPPTALTFTKTCNTPLSIAVDACNENHCEPGQAVGVTETNFYRLTQSIVSPADRTRACKVEYGEKCHAASVLSWREQSRMTSALRGGNLRDERVWLGATRDSKGIWKWADGTPIAGYFENWDTLQGKNGAGQPYMCVQWNNGGKMQAKWHDCEANDGELRVMCKCDFEGDKNPEPHQCVKILDHDLGPLPNGDFHEEAGAVTTSAPTASPTRPTASGQWQQLRGWKVEGTMGKTSCTSHGKTPPASVNGGNGHFSKGHDPLPLAMKMCEEDPDCLGFEDDIQDGGGLWFFSKPSCQGKDSLKFSVHPARENKDMTRPYWFQSVWIKGTNTCESLIQSGQFTLPSERTACPSASTPPAAKGYAPQSHWVKRMTDEKWTIQPAYDNDFKTWFKTYPCQTTNCGQTGAGSRNAALLQSDTRNAELLGTGDCSVPELIDVPYSHMRTNKLSRYFSKTGKSGIKEDCVWSPGDQGADSHPGYGRCDAYGRGKLDDLYGWVVDHVPSGNPWWQHDVGMTSTLLGVDTQGRSDICQYVKSYKFKVSTDGDNWIDVDGGKVYQAAQCGGWWEGSCRGATCRNNHHRVLFAKPVQARYLRIYPMSAGPGQSEAGLRSLPLGCKGADTAFPKTGPPAIKYNEYGYQWVDINSKGKPASRGFDKYANPLLTGGFCAEGGTEKWLGGCFYEFPDLKAEVVAKYGRVVYWSDQRRDFVEEYAAKLIKTSTTACDALDNCLGFTLDPRQHVYVHVKKNSVRRVSECPVFGGSSAKRFYNVHNPDVEVWGVQNNHDARCFKKVDVKPTAPPTNRPTGYPSGPPMTESPTMAPVSARVYGDNWKSGMSGDMLKRKGYNMLKLTTEGHDNYVTKYEVDLSGLDNTCDVSAYGTEDTCNCPGSDLGNGYYWHGGKGGCFGASHFGLSTSKDVHVHCAKDGFNLQGDFAMNHYDRNEWYGHFHRWSVDEGVYAWGKGNDHCIGEDEWSRRVEVYACKSKGAASVSGDPFVVDATGQKIQFFLPLHEEVMLLKCNDMQLFGSAFDSGISGDHQQWFNKFLVKIDGSEALTVSIKKNATEVADDSDIVAADQKTGQANKLLTVNVEGTEMMKTGAFAAESGALIAVWHSESSETVQFSLNTLVMQIKSAVAQKFDDKKIQQLYTHLDLRFVELKSAECNAGVLAEIWGTAPMGQKTAAMLQPPGQ